MRFGEIRLLVRNFDACFRFYRDVMHFPVTFGTEGETYASFDANEVTIALFPRALMAESIGTDPREDVGSAQDRVTLSFMVDSVDATIRDLEGRGVVFVAGPTNRPEWGGRVAHFRDPEGTLIELYESIPMLDD